VARRRGGASAAWRVTLSRATTGHEQTTERLIQLLGRGHSASSAEAPDYDCLLERAIMKPSNFKSKRLEVFCGLLILGGVFYVVDCLTVIIFKDHPEVPWFESGIYAGGPAGFFWTAATIVCAFGYLIFGKDK
jgi:hypothetical protein